MDGWWNSIFFPVFHWEQVSQQYRRHCRRWRRGKQNKREKIRFEFEFQFGCCSCRAHNGFVKWNLDGDIALRAVSERFRNGSRAVSGRFQSWSGICFRAHFEQFKLNLRAIQGCFQSSLGVIRELNWSSFQGNFWAVLMQFRTAPVQFKSRFRALFEQFKFNWKDISVKIKSSSRAISEQF